MWKSRQTRQEKRQSHHPDLKNDGQQGLFGSHREDFASSGDCSFRPLLSGGITTAGGTEAGSELFAIGGALGHMEDI